MDELEEAIDEIPELSKPISIVNLVKYSNKRILQRKTRILIYPLRRTVLYLVPRKKCGQNSRDNVMKAMWIPQDLPESQHLCVMKAVIKLPKLTED
jgi:hypothetical protein